MYHVPGDLMTETRMLTSMARLALAGTFVAGLASVAAAQDPVKKGQELFTSQKCTMCHSVAGVGNKKFPLDGVGAKLSAADLKEWIVNPDAMQAKLGTEAGDEDEVVQGAAGGRRRRARRVPGFVEVIAPIAGRPASRPPPALLFSRRQPCAIDSCSGCARPPTCAETS